MRNIKLYLQVYWPSDRSYFYLNQKIWKLFKNRPEKVKIFEIVSCIGKKLKVN